MLAGIALAFLARIACAHDIPNDVKVQAFVKPEGKHLLLLARVPMSGMREADIPVVGPGFIDMPRADGPLRTAARLWLVDNVEVYENDNRIGPPNVAAARVALSSDKSFQSYDKALATVRSPPLTDADLYWKQQYVDVLLEYPITSDRSDFAIYPRLARLGLQVTTVLRFLPPGGPERAFEVHGDGELLHLDPRWHHAALRFVELGFRHILDGTDHLLFIACLVIPFRRLRPLIVIATAFTIAHSITLTAAAFGIAPKGLWFPPLVEMLIATSIVYMALENIVGSNPMRRWMIAFAFGLVHGFGFAFALRESLQFAGSHLITALLAFNVGVELGQLLVLVLLVPLLGLLFRFAVAERMGTILLSALLAHTGWHWLIERFDRLRQFRFEWPLLNAALLAAATRWLMAAVIAGGLAWLVFGVFLPSLRRRAANDATDDATEAETEMETGAED